MNYYIKNSKVKRMFNMFMITSIVMMIFSIISPLYDLGNNIVIVLSILFITVMMAKDANTKVFVKLVRIAIILLIVYYLSIFALVKYIDVSRNNYIKEQISNDVSVIEVKANPTYMIWRYNPVDYFQIKDFKDYYEIPDKCTLNVRHFGLFEKVEKRIKR